MRRTNVLAEKPAGTSRRLPDMLNLQQRLALSHPRATPAQRGGIPVIGAAQPINPRNALPAQTYSPLGAVKSRRAWRRPEAHRAVA